MRAGWEEEGSPLLSLEGTECVGKKLQSSISVLSLEYNKITPN